MKKQGIITMVGTVLASIGGFLIGYFKVGPWLVERRYGKIGTDYGAAVLSGRIINSQEYDQNHNSEEEP